MELLETLIPEKYLFALGWMIIHAIWQIAGIGLILWLIIRTFSQKSAAFKYRLSISALFLISSLAIWSFLFHLQEKPNATEFTFNQTELDYFISQGDAIGSTIIEPYFDWFIIANKIESWIPFMVQLWILGAMLFLVRFGTSLADLRNISIKNHEMVDPQWMQVLQQQMALLQLKKPIILLNTIHLDQPVTYGVLRPVILIPASLFFQLSPVQLEAILAHELAHIKRYDYLVNLLQSFLEVIFFFHPVFWWINKTARDLRENACDDMAIKMGTAPKDLAYGLANVLNHANKPIPEVAMAAARPKNPTLDRIKRIMGVKTSPTQPTTLTSITMMITILLGATLLVGASDKPAKDSFEDLMSTKVNTITIEGNWTGQYAFPKKDTIPPKSPVIMEMDWDKMTPEQQNNFRKEMEELKEMGVFFKEAKPVIEGMPDFGSYFKAFSIAPFDLEMAPIPFMEFSMAPLPPVNFDMTIIPDMSGLPIMDITSAPLLSFPDSTLFRAAPMAIYFSGDSSKFYNFNYNYNYSIDTTNMSKAEIEKKRAEMRTKMVEADEKRAAAVEKWHETNKAKVAEWQKKHEVWEKEFTPRAKEFEAKMKEWEKANGPKMEEYHQKMMEWEKENQPRIEEFQKKMEEWQKANQPKMEEFQLKMEIWQKENQVKLEEFQKKMEIWQKEHQEKMQELQKSIYESTKKGDN